MEKIEIYKEKLKKIDTFEIIKWAINEFGESKIKFASSLGLEDQVITEMILKINNKIEIFTLDTGRLFQETYLTIEKTERKYNFRYKIYFPDYKEVEDMVNTKGINLFYESIENRKSCCKIRKLNPLKRALNNVSCWICGLRREQSSTRKDIDIIEWDESNGLYKLNPLYDWSLDDVWNYIKENKIPYNPLHDEGFPSIGCKPCTRAIKEGEDIRSGRWWWENPEHKECGLHSRR